MFTGIIEDLGTVAAVNFDSGGGRLTVRSRVVTADFANGDSIAVNGVCLTAVDAAGDEFSADVSPETLERTTLGQLITDSRVNLERAVTPATRLGGHIVQGHVDGRGTFDGASSDGEFWTVRIRFPAEIRRYFVFKGSVAVEGISLTIAKLEDQFFEIAVIPKTWDVTNLSTLSVGNAVNLEADIFAKYVENMVRFGRSE